MLTKNSDSACVKHDISDIKLMLKNSSAQEKLERNQEEVKNYLNFFRFFVFELLVSKRSKETQKFKFSSKVAKFTEKIRIDLTIIFCSYDFFVQFLVFEIFPFEMHSGLKKKFGEKKFVLRTLA